MVKFLLYASVFFSAMVSFGAEQNDSSSLEKIFPAIKDYFTFGIYEFGSNPGHRKLLEKNQNITNAQLNEFYAETYAENNLNTVLTPHDHYIKPCAEHGLNLILHKFFFYSSRNNPEKAKKEWRDYVEKYKNNPNILSWYLYDEIETPKIGEDIEKIRKSIFEIDKLHPCSVITSSVHENVAKLFQYYMWDCYMFYTAMADGGSLGRLKLFARQAAKYAPYINVAVIQANDYGNYDPSPAEVKAQTFTVLANGSNGVLYYLGSVPLYAWAKWSREDKYFSIANLREKALLDFYGTPNKKLCAISEMGEKLLPRGYLLVSGKYVPDASSISVICDKYMRTVSKENKNKILVADQEEIPAVEVGLWKNEDAWIIIPYNNDVRQTRKAEISVAMPSDGHCIYNLWTLQKMELKNGKSFNVELAPGDGCFFLCSTPEKFEKEKNTILQKDTELRLKKLAFNVNDPGNKKLLNLNEVTASIEESRNFLTAGKYEDANNMAKKAEKAFEETKKNSKAYASIENSIKKCRSVFQKLNTFLSEKSVVFYDTSWWQPILPGHDLAVLDSPIGFGLPKLDNTLQKLRAESGKFFPLFIAFRNGRDEELEKRFGELSDNLEKISAELQEYKFEKGPDKIKLGFLVLGLPDGKKNYTENAWDFANLCVKNASMIVLSEDGKFMDTDGREVNLDDFDLLWWDYSTPEGAGFLDRKKQVNVSAAILKQTTIECIREFLKKGKGLLLTKLACFYVVPLGIEDVEPNYVEINKKSFSTDVLMGSQVTYKIQLGIKPTPGNEKHAVFNSLALAGTFFKGEDLTKARSRASWVYPAVPQKGNVIGQFEAYFLPVPDNKYFDLVEFPCGKGRVLACASPGLDFDLNFSDRGKRYWRHLEMQKFIFNILEYLGSSGKWEDFVRQENNRPYCHTDVAKIEFNPALTWKASSGNPAPLFKSVRGGSNVWISEENNASIECDFRKMVTIDKVVVNSFFYNSRWNTVHLRLKIKDEKTGNFVDLNPPAIYDNSDLIWEAARFSFPPLKTSAIRIEEIRRAPDRVALKGYTVKSLPNGIANITVYGDSK